MAEAKSPSTIQSRIRGMVLFVIVPFILAVLVMNVIIIYTAAQRVRESAESSLTIQAQTAQNTLNSIENEILSIIGSQGYYVQAFSQKLDEMNLYLVSSYLYRDLSRFALFTAEDDCFFCYSVPNENFQLAAPERSFEEKKDLQAGLLSFLNNGSSRKRGDNWSHAEIGGTHYMIYCLNMNGAWFGGMIPVSSLIQSADELDRYITLKDGLSLRISSDGDIFEEMIPENEAVLNAKDGSGRFEIKYIFRQVVSRVAFLSPLFVIVAASVILLALVAFATRRVSRKISEPVRELDLRMKDFQGGEMEAKLEEPFEFSELEAVRGTFNEMTDRIFRLKNSVYEEKLARQKTEFDFLQLQIKPHFYLNCLNQIFILSQMGKKEAVSELSLKLLAYFRYLLKQDQNLVPLSEELSHIDDYLYIQKMRYPAGFLYEKDVDPELENAEITPLLLITFIENSLKYAYSAYGELTISLRAEKVEEKCRIVIEDSGGGFPEEVLTALEDQENAEVRAADGRKCIGITNAVQRLRYAYGEDAEIHFSNEGINGGSRVEIVVPDVYA